MKTVSAGGRPMDALRRKTIVITRAREQAVELEFLLRAAGANPVTYPAIRIVPPENTTEVDRAIDQLSSFTLLVFTSVNSIDAFASRMTSRRIGMPAIVPPVAAVGAATARAAEAHGFEVVLVPNQFTAASLARDLRALPRGKVLLLRADIGSSTVRDALIEDGWEVLDVVAYQTLPGDGSDDLARGLREGKIDAITFCSSSAVRYTVEGLTGSGDIHFLLFDSDRPAVICLGSVTAETARDMGVRVDAVAARHDANGLVEAVADWFTRMGPLNG